MKEKNYILEQKIDDPFGGNKQQDPFGGNKQQDPFGGNKQQDPFKKDKTDTKPDAKSEPKKEKLPPVDLKKCKKSTESWVDKNGDSWSWEDIQDNFEVVNGPHPNQAEYSVGMKMRQEQMCRSWNNGWRPDFGKECPDNFPIEKGCRNDKIKEIQRCLKMPIKNRTGRFDNLTSSYLVGKGFNGEEITSKDYKKICNYMDPEELSPSDLGGGFDIKEDILSMHINFKKILQEEKKKKNMGLIFEQIQPDPKLQQAINDGCLKEDEGEVIRYGGKVGFYKVAQMDDTKGRYVKGDKLIYYGDNTFVVNPQLGDRAMEYSWSCTGVQKQMDKGLLDEYTRNGWVTFDKIVNKAQANDKNFYISMKVNGVPGGMLYLPKEKWQNVPFDSEKLATIWPKDSVQYNWLNKLVERYSNLTLNPSPYDVKYLTKVNAPEAEGYFPNGLDIYFNPKNKVEVGGTQYSKERVAQTMDTSKCEDYIESYWDFYTRSDRNVNPEMEADFVQLKDRAQRCVRDHAPNWKDKSFINFDKGKLNKISCALAGLSNGYNRIPGPPQRSNWRLQPSNALYSFCTR
jgi:hypothetical protein